MGAVASLGPLYWLAHNWWYWGDCLEFYRGPYSAKAIYQRALAGGMAKYPGDHEWGKAWLYFRDAVMLCAGRPLAWLAMAGAIAALAPDLGAVAILTSLAMLVTPLASTGDSWVLSTHWHASSESGRKELLFNLLVVNFGMKVLWVVIFWLLSPIVLPQVIREKRVSVAGYFFPGFMRQQTGSVQLSLA